ncbi:MAG: fused MFS/spermidine synthase [Solirubrobacterales bacterium]|nr:fused MFS/spermidine synthase [Solirubrobacterales bacterium]
MSRRALFALVFAGGVSSLGAEIAAARLLAPYFGASTIIWANTIGVVLVALSIGYWYGGRLADRYPSDRYLRLVVLVAAVMLALIPIVSDPFFGVVVGAFDRLDAGAFVGSLLGVLVLLAVPLVLLGTVTPWALRLAISEVENAGTVAGRLYALSTIGSLVGVFLSALVLIPLIGTQRTFIVFGAGLAITAASGANLPRAARVVPVVLLAALFLPPGVTKPAEDADRAVIAEAETNYQYLRVIQADGRRLLELNEGQAVHSIYDPGTVLTDGVWDGYLSLPLSVLGRAPRSMAMLGDAAGTVSRAYGRFFPETRIDGVEIDREVTEAGRKYFDLGTNERLTTHTEDARPFLRRTKKRYDLIALDAYRQPYIPFYLATREFFALTKARLTPGGAVVVNVGHPAGQDQLEQTITRTMLTSYRHVARFPIEDTSTLLVGSDVPPDRERIRRYSAQADAELVPLLGRTETALAPPLSGGSVYTDDKAPVEWLIDSSIVRYAAGGEGG